MTNVKSDKKNFDLKKLLLQFSFFILILGSLFYVYKTLAQNTLSSQSLEVSPPSQDLSIDPGKTINVKAKIRNPSRNTIDVQARLEDFTTSGEEGQIAFTKNSSYSIVSWSKLSPEKFTLSPGQTEEVTATITIPQNAAGGRYGSFVFSILPPGDQTAGTKATVSQELASLFLLKISGPVNENLTLTQFSAPSFQEFGPVPLSLKFSNSGNVHVKTFGVINVSNMWGGKTADVVVTGTNILPQASRIVKVNLEKQFLIGNFTATAIMYYGSKNQPLTAITHFVVFPIRVAFILIVIVFLLYLMRKRLIKAFKVLFK